MPEYPHVSVDSEHGLIYVDLQAGLHHRTVERPGFNIDYDEAGNILGVEVFTSKVEWRPKIIKVEPDHPLIQWEIEDD